MLPKERGLKQSEAQDKLAEFGPNTLPENPPPSDFSIFISQLKSPLVYVLLAAGLITSVLGEFADASIIFFAVLINTILGFIQERKAEHALLALKSFVHPKASIIRDDKIVEIDAKDIVPGDVVVISSGDKIPADGYFTETNRLFVSEAILTGESSSVNKSVGDKGFMGTYASYGKGVLKVESTGAATELGKIATGIQQPDEDTPLTIQLKSLGKNLTVMVIFLTAFVFGVGLLAGRQAITLFTTSVALSVSAIPEGLLVSLTVVLALGMQKILKKKGLVRNLVSAETLGEVSIICADKTGTLTKGEMSVSATYGSEEDLVFQSIIANDLDDPIVTAAYSWAKESSMKWELDYKSLASDYKRFDSIPFSPKERFFASLNSWDKTNNMLFVNGAPEYLVEWSIIDKAEKDRILAEIQKFTSNGMRVVGMARKKVGVASREIKDSDVRSNLRFIGLIAFSDPVRPGVKNALAKTKAAGIEMLVITGDYAETAVSVMNHLGVSVGENSVLTGKELDAMSAEELSARLKANTIRIFARTTPDQKLKIIEALKKNGEVVAMMGDGVNDALALKHADIGIVVASASDVAKETADLVLLDSNYETIIAAIEEGRGIYANIKKIILYLISDSFEEIIATVGTIILGLPFPVTAAQILWVNIISDGFPNLALTVDPQDKGLMSKPPRPKGEPLMLPWMKAVIAIVSLASGLSALAIFVFYYKTTGDLNLARSIAFIAIGMNSLVYVFSIRTLTHPFWVENPFNNKWLNIAVIAGLAFQFVPFLSPTLSHFFKLEYPGVGPILVVVMEDIGLFVIIEVIKSLGRRHIIWFRH